MGRLSDGLDDGRREVGSDDRRREQHANGGQMRVHLSPVADYCSTGCGIRVDQAFGLEKSKVVGIWPPLNHVQLMMR